MNYFVAITATVALTSIWTLIVYDRVNQGPGKYPVAYSDKELGNKHFLQSTAPISMKLNIVDTQTWEKTRGDPNVAAYSQPYQNTCVITIPEGWMIEVKPQDKEARWLNPEHGHYLAHEILHCLRGGWHPK